MRSVQRRQQRTASASGGLRSWALSLLAPAPPWSSQVPWLSRVLYLQPHCSVPNNNSSRPGGEAASLATTLRLTTQLISGPPFPASPALPHVCFSCSGSDSLIASQYTFSYTRPSSLLGKYRMWHPVYLEPVSL